MQLARLRGIVALSAALWLVPAGSSAASGAAERRETEVVDRSFPFNPDGHLKLKNFSGRVTINGSNRGNVVVHAVRRAPRERLAGIRLEIEAIKSVLKVLIVLTVSVLRVSVLTALTCHARFACRC